MFTTSRFSTSSFSKIGLAAAVIAIGSMATIDLAEAKRGDGARNRDGLTSAQKAQRRAKRQRQTNKATRHQDAVQTANYRNYIQNKKRKKNRNAKKLARAIGSIAVAAAANQRHQNRHDVLAYQNNRGNHNWRGNNRRHNHRYNDQFVEQKCVAVAKTRHGNGHRIGNIRAKAFGRRACRKAMRRCSNKLYDRRQSFGRNPHAECVVVRRTGGRFSRR